MHIGMDKDWTELTSRDVDIPEFIRNLEKMRAGGSMECPFCGGTVRMTADYNEKNEYACDSCDMRITTES